MLPEPSLATCSLACLIAPQSLRPRLLPSQAHAAGVAAPAPPYQQRQQLRLLHQPHAGTLAPPFPPPRPQDAAIVSEASSISLPPPPAPSSSQQQGEGGPVPPPAPSPPPTPAPEQAAGAAGQPAGVPLQQPAEEPPEQPAGPVPGSKEAVQVGAGSWVTGEAAGCGAWGVGMGVGAWAGGNVGEGEGGVCACTRTCFACMCLCMHGDGLRLLALRSPPPCMSRQQRACWWQLLSGRAGRAMRRQAYGGGHSQPEPRERCHPSPEHTRPFRLPARRASWQP